MLMARKTSQIMSKKLANPICKALIAAPLQDRLR